MAHPAGRLIGTREPVAFDMERVLDAAAARGVWMEINAQPDRTDLSDVNARLAHEKGIGIVIDTDAHSIGQLDLVRFGMFAARRAGLTKRDVMNTQPWEKFSHMLERRRQLVPVPVAKPKAVAPEPVPAHEPAHEPVPTAASTNGRGHAERLPVAESSAAMTPRPAAAPAADASARVSARPATKARSASRPAKAAAKKRAAPKKAATRPAKKRAAPKKAAGKSTRKRSSR